MPHHLISNTPLRLSTARIESLEEIKSVKDSFYLLAGYCDNNFKPFVDDPSDFYGLVSKEVASFIEKDR